MAGRFVLQEAIKLYWQLQVDEGRGRYWERRYRQVQGYIFRHRVTLSVHSGSENGTLSAKPTDVNDTSGCLNKLKLKLQIKTRRNCGMRLCTSHMKTAADTRPTACWMLVWKKYSSPIQQARKRVSLSAQTSPCVAVRHTVASLPAHLSEVNITAAESGHSAPQVRGKYTGL